MDDIHTEVVLLIPIVLFDAGGLRPCPSHVALGSLMSELVSLLVNLGPCSFRNWKLQADIVHHVKPVDMFVDIGYHL